jgi:cellulose synthase/poly-beta-1,6-N-acetylglucosamine synthase-like glycosyltransferase
MARIKLQEKLGSVVLLHDAGGDRSATVDALPKIIEYYKSKGYEFTTVAGLINKNRDYLMPELKSSDDIFYSKFNWFIAEFIFGLEKFLYFLFYSGLILSGVRLITIAVLSSIQRSKSNSNHLKDNQTRGLVSVIVPAYNEGENALRTLRAIVSSSYSKLEVIYVDDGSSDNSFELVEKEFLGIENVKIFSKVNGGKASALNFGIDKASGEIVVCIDADTLLDKNAIYELVKHFDSDSVGAVAGNVKVGNKINLFAKWQSIEYITSQNFDRRAFDILNSISVIPGAIGAFRKDIVLSVGKFDTDTLAEDCDITIRILSEGYIIKYADKAVAYTEVPEDLSMFLKQRFRWSFGILQSIWKHKNFIISLKHKNLGFVALPNALLFQFFLPLFSPIVDIVMIISILSGEWQNTLLFYGIFILIDIITSFIAFSFEKEDIKLLPLLIPQRIIYRQLLFFVLIKSFASAIKGSLVGWGHLKRTGNVVRY